MSDAMRQGLARRFSRRVAERVLDAMAGTDVACSLPLSLADAFDATTFGRLEHEAARRGIDPGRLAIEVPFAYIAGNLLSRTWLRAARRSRVRLILDAGDTGAAALAHADMTPFSEIQVPIKTLLAEDARAGHEVVPGLAARLPVAAVGVGSRQLLLRAVAAGAQYAAGDVFGKRSEEVGSLPRKVDLG
jgi:EAL domain-containing protein (putative c-di-GMP-specific phosphodiesterase class I)